MTFGWLPELDTISFRVGDPAEPTVLVLFDPVDDVHAVLPQFRENPIEIVNSKVQHEAAVGRPKVVGVGREHRPHRRPRGTTSTTPAKDRKVAVLDRYAQPVSIPRSEHFRVSSLEEHTTDARDTCHVLQPLDDTGDGLALPYAHRRDAVARVPAVPVRRGAWP